MAVMPSEELRTVRFVCAVLESRRVFAALRFGFTQHTDTYNTISEDLSSLLQVFIQMLYVI